MRDMYIQQYRHAPEHTNIHILMQTFMYVEVWNIMVCNQNVPDPNKHELTPDVVRERPWRLSDSWKHIVDRRERRRHSHARTQTRTRICARTQTHGIRARTRTHADAYTHAQTHTHTRTQTHTRIHARTHTKTNSHAHTRTHADTHMPPTFTHTRTRIHMTSAEGSTPSRVREPGKGGETVEVGNKREREGALMMGYIESISFCILIVFFFNLRVFIKE